MDENDTVKKLAKLDPYLFILKKSTVSNQEVDRCEKEWLDQNLKNFGDFVCHYNNLDVIGMVEGIEK